MEEVLTALLTQQFFVAAVLAAILAMLVTEKGLVTSKRYNEQKKRADDSEHALNENTARLEHLSNVLADTNDTLKLLIRERKP